MSVCNGFSFNHLNDKIASLDFIDFGLNNQPMGVSPNDPIPIAQRLIVNFFTAKRLLAALNMSIQRHEAAFGVLETDVQKRIQPAALRQAGMQPKTS